MNLRPRLAWCGLFAFALTLGTMTAASAATNTLDKLRSGKPLIIGYVDQNLPFSASRGSPDQPEGVTVDLCKLVVEQMKKDLQLPNITVQYRVVTFDTRFTALDNNEIDLECASSTVTRARLEKYSFTPSFYVTGVRLMVAKGSTAQSLDQFVGKTIAVVTNTTGESIVRTQNELASLKLNLKVYEDTDTAVAAVANKEADAFPFDEILLYAFISAIPDGNKKLDVVGRFLSVEPYGLMMRLNDEAFERAVSGALAEVLATRSAVETYDRWFRNAKLDAPMNRLTKEVFAMPSRDPAFP